MAPEQVAANGLRTRSGAGSELARLARERSPPDARLNTESAAAGERPTPRPRSECYDGLVSTNRPARALATSQQLLTWSGAPAEIIGGELIERAAPSPQHGSAQFALSGLLFSPFGSSRGPGGPGEWWLMTDVEIEYEAHEVFRHDHVGFRRDRHPERPAGRPVKERPDWVCEILSASNASNDTVRKLRTLQRAGVPHYWLIDPERLTLTVLRWTSEGYLEALLATADETVRAEPFDAIELPLVEIFGPG